MNKKNMMQIKEALIMPSGMADAIAESCTAGGEHSCGNHSSRCVPAPTAAASIPPGTAGSALLLPPPFSVSSRSAPPLLPTLYIRRSSLPSLWMPICPKPRLTI